MQSLADSLAQPLATIVSRPESGQKIALGAQGITDSWETIRGKLSTWMRLTTTPVTADGERIECRQDTRPDAEAAALARAAGVQPQLDRVRTRTPLG